MPLKFVFGPSGSGKSYHLYNHIIQESVAHPEQNFIVLVPEQFTMQTQKDLVELHPKKGIMNIDVLSFNRLAYRVFEETGGDQLPMLDDEGKNLILRKIAVNEDDKLQVLKGNMKKLGYISEVKSVISEFTQYDIGEEEITQVMESAGQDSRLGEKLADILVLYRGFRDYLQEKYITKEELLDVLAGQVSQSKMLQNSTIALDGFTGFTPVQNRLLKELLLCCRDVWVTVTMDPKEDPYRYRTPYQLFALGKHMTTSLIRLAEEAKVPVREPLCLYDEVPYRFRDNPALTFLEKNLFRQRQETFEEAQDVIRLAVADNPREETLHVASRIRALVRKEDLRYRDIGIIVSDMDTYGDYLMRAFDQYEIPYFMDHKRSLLLNSFVEYLRSLLDMVRQNFTGDSVFRFLRTGYAGYTAEEIDALENYVLALGIRGYKKWQGRWDRLADRMDEEELDRLNHLRVEFVEKVDGLHQVLKQRRKTVGDITTALYEFLVREDMQVQLKKQEEAFRDEGELALAKEYAQVYRVVMDLFDKFVELLGDEPVSLEEYCQLLDAGLEEAKVGVVPPSVDQVVAGDLERTRLKDIKVLFFLGASDAYLPGPLMQTGLLTERDRQMFEQEKLSLSPNGKEKAYEQKYYLYLQLTKPSEKLEISYSKSGTDGKSARPSYLIQELRKLYPHLSAEDVSDLPFDEQELTPQMGVRPLIFGLRDGLSGAEDADFWRELYSWYRRNPKWRGKLTQLLYADFYSNPRKNLPADLARRLYGEAFKTSITRMETYAKCAYRHFLDYGLRLCERQEYAFSFMDFGSVCHKALELYGKKLEEEHLEWTDADADMRHRLIEESVTEAAADYGNDILHSTAGNACEITQIQSLLERNIESMTWQLSQGDFRPEALETWYENGKIDRVDTCRDASDVYVKVIDYKTGSETFEEDEVYYGLRLQLMVYMEAALKLAGQWYPGETIVPAGAFYNRINDPYVSGEKNGKKKTEGEVQQELRREMRPDGLVNVQEGVLKHLEHHRSGSSLVAPVEYDKNGMPKTAGNSKTADGEDFRLLMEHAAAEVDKDARQILDGDTSARPYKKGKKDGCSYCPYRSVCGFDLQVPGYRNRDLADMDHEEIVTKLRAEKGTAGEEQ